MIRVRGLRKDYPDGPRALDGVDLDVARGEFVALRAAAILGFVGAGGIGFYIQTHLRLLNYRAAASVLLVLIVLVMIVNFASSRLRARLV